jgi:hypothetical protein
MTLPVRWTAVLLFAAATLGCSDDSDPDSEPGAETGNEIEIDVVAADLSALMCEAQATCECRPEPVAAHCAAAITPAVASGVARGQVQGLRYHEECVDLTAAALAGLGCRLDHETVGDEDLANLEHTAARCKLLAGDDVVGDPCQAERGDGTGRGSRSPSCEQRRAHIPPVRFATSGCPWAWFRCGACRRGRRSSRGRGHARDRSQPSSRMPGASRPVAPTYSS